MHTESEPPKDLLELIDLEEIDTNLYRGRNEDERGWPSLFGGQAAAQALMAAGLTVPEGRFPHSLHGYFLRPGTHEHPVLFQVSRERDGRSFSARHVLALQFGEVIFSMSASFHTPRPGPDFLTQRPGAPAGPEAYQVSTLGRPHSMLEIKPVPRGELGEGGFPSRMWARFPGDLGDDRLVHACAMAYLSDVGSGFVDSGIEGLPRGGPSLDHAMWFHEPIRLDDWVFWDMWPLKAGGARGLYAGAIYDQNGTLGCMMTQESLLREMGDGER